LGQKGNLLNLFTLSGIEDLRRFLKIGHQRKTFKDCNFKKWRRYDEIWDTPEFGFHTPDPLH